MRLARAGRFCVEKRPEFCFIFAIGYFSTKSVDLCKIKIFPIYGIFFLLLYCLFDII